MTRPDRGGAATKTLGPSGAAGREAGPVRLSILLVSFNTREMTLECLRSVYAQTRSVPFEVIVVENASSDGSAEAIGEAFPQARLIALEKNIGFAAGNNLAASHARGELLLLLNPDTVVLDGAIDRLLDRAAEHPEAGIYGGRTIFADGTVNATACFGMPSVRGAVCRAFGLAALGRGTRLFDPESADLRRREGAQHVPIVTGCLFLLRADLWRRLGGLDESFFVYGEEVDLCLRARRLGVRPMVFSDVTIVHHGGASETVRAEKMVHLLRGKARLMLNHWSPARRRMGVAALDFWCLSRWLAWSLAARLGRRGAGEQAETWRAIWRRRGEWRADALRRTMVKRSASSPADAQGAGS